jgi:hypothetical protein
VLRELGQGFEFSPAQQLSEVDPVEAVLFINCGAAVPVSADQLRTFVESGGTIYASDLQAPLIAEVYPEAFRANSGGEAKTVTARVVDQGLRTTIGAEIDLHFDLGGWKYLEPITASVRTYIEAESRPLLVSYQSLQGGTVFYTAFHNVRQNSEQKRELLRFLIFRPILSREMRDSAESLSNQDLTIEREYTGGLRRDREEQAFPIPAAGSWTARLSWSGQGRIGLQLVSSTGSITAECDGWVSPLEVSDVALGAGSSVRVRYLDFVQKEIPFFVHLAAGSRSAAGRLRGSLLRTTAPKEIPAYSRPPGLTGTLAKRKEP